METLNNVATAASKAVFGGSDANKEPVSGVQGDVSKGEPYDAGNLDVEEQKKVETRLSSDNVAGKVDAVAPLTSTAATVQDAPKADMPNTPSPTVAAVAASGEKPVESLGDIKEGSSQASTGPDAATSVKDPEQKTAAAKADSASGEGSKTNSAEASKTSAGTTEEKKEDQKNSTSDTPSGSKDSTKQNKSKPSLSQRIKAKFHRKG